MRHLESVPVVIIGGGPAGYTSAIYTARAGLTPVCIEGFSSGGQIVRSNDIHNFPGHPDGIAGSELADSIRSQAVRFGARIVMAQVNSVDLSGPLDDPCVSRRHARITLSGTAPLLEDLQSANGTYVNNTRVDRVVPGGAWVPSGSKT